MTNEETLLPVTPEVINTIKKLKKNIDAFEHTQEDYDNHNKMLEEYYKLQDSYDWNNIEYEENGKIGLKDVEGNILVPAIYDGFNNLETYFSKGFGVIAVKDGKCGMVKCDGKGTPVTPFEYSAIYHLPYMSVYLVKKDGSDRKAVMMYGKVITPYVIDKCWVPCDGYMIFESDGKQGLVGIDSYDVYVAPEYDEIYDMGIGNNFIFEKDGVEGLVTFEGLFMTQAEYDALPEEEADRLVPTGFIFGDDGH